MVALQWEQGSMASTTLKNLIYTPLELSGDGNIGVARNRSSSPWGLLDFAGGKTPVDLGILLTEGELWGIWHGDDSDGPSQSLHEVSNSLPSEIQSQGQPRPQSPTLSLSGTRTIRLPYHTHIHAHIHTRMHTQI